MMTTTVPRVLVHEVMQDFYQQLGRLLSGTCPGAQGSPCSAQLVVYPTSPLRTTPLRYLLELTWGHLRLIEGKPRGGTDGIYNIYIMSCLIYYIENLI